MEIESFIDTISKCEKYTLIIFAVKIDELTGESVNYFTHLNRTSSARSEEEFQILKDRVTQYLYGKSNIILIDFNRKKIFKESNEDKFLLDSLEKVPYSIEAFDVKNLNEIIGEMSYFPLADQFDRGTFTCIMI